ncbi:MAG: thioredoxin family protein [Bacilli bacterium]|jgi:hypothetical protein|nr:thioredoxin family protein [Bacilli bacterium]
MRVIVISAIWCSSCLVMKKAWTNAKQAFPDLEWVEYDLDFDQEASLYQDLEKLPVLIFEKNGLECSRLIGEKSVEEVISWVNENTSI